VGQSEKEKNARILKNHREGKDFEIKTTYDADMESILVATNPGEGNTWEHRHEQEKRKKVFQHRTLQDDL